MIVSLEAVIDAIASHPEVHQLLLWNVDRGSLSYEIWLNHFVRDVRATLSGQVTETPIQVQLFPKDEETKESIVVDESKMDAI